ncbi:hypothetical protein ACP70R_022805 [Stipagrostis hirtigluma subsp. patula]
MSDFQREKARTLQQSRIWGIGESGAKENMGFFSVGREIAKQVNC